MALNTQQIVARIEAMRMRSRAADERKRIILAIRDNDYESVAPGLLPDEFRNPMVANLIDTAAHDLSEVMAPLPTVSCGSDSETTAKKKQFAAQRTLIAQGYLERSNVSDQMYSGADRYLSFGQMAYFVEPDFEAKTPNIRVDDSLSSYFECDYRDRVVQFVNISRHPGDSLALLYPEFAEAIRSHAKIRNNSDVEVAEWRDRDAIVVVIPETGLVLSRIENVLDRVPIRLVRRPSLRGRGDSKGQFDDVVWVQVARALTAAYTMNAVDQSVNAPLAMPNDVQELELGPLSAIQSDNPQNIGRVALNVPPGLFPQLASLSQEQRVGSRYPEGRSGNIDANIITGQGVQALMGTFDTQVQTFQRLNESALEDVLSMCFEMDEKLWPNSEKSVRVHDAGSPVEITYVPSKDIAGTFSIDVAYGAVAGLDPNRSLIFLLQAVSGGFMSRETGRKHMPVDLDHVAETRRMDLESIRESMLGSVAAMAQAIPQMAAAGQDPREIVMQMARVIELRGKGKTIDEAVREVFAPKEKPGEQAADPQADIMAALQQAQQGGGGPPGGGSPGGGQGGPQIEGPQSPGQDLLMGLAGLTPGGSPNLQSNVSTRAVAQ